MKRFCILAVLLLSAVAVSAQPKKVSILGDSYSTYQGYNPEGYNPFYPDAHNDVASVDQTWWSLYIKTMGYQLEKNNSWGATTICGTGYFRRDVSASNFISRVEMLGDPDIIFLFGGTNDAWAGSPVGEYQYADWTKEDCMNFRPALACLLDKLQKTYPKATIYSLLNSELREEINESMREVCKHYGVQLIELQDIEKQNGHPSIQGMKSICRQIIAATGYPQPDLNFELWPDGAPSDNGLRGEEKDYGNHVSNVTRPTLSIFLPEKCNGLALLVCPGGGYVDVWDKTEGYYNARWYTEQGLVYAVLKYRLPNGHCEVPMEDVHQAMAILKARADEFGFTKLGIAGCSAGGHLAATAATHFTTPEERPDFQVLFYPVISTDPAITHGGSAFYLLGRNPSQALLDKYSNEKQVTANTPPAFIMANSDDGVVPCENSIRYYEALRANKVPAALHIYPVGGHGWADHVDFPYRDAWMGDLKVWLAALAKAE